MRSLSVLKDSISVFSTIGNYRSSNEDTYHIELLSFETIDLLFFGIFDGHAGPHCSNFLRENITKYFQFTKEDLSDIEKLKNSITSSCYVLNQVFFSAYPDSYDGSCALMSFILQINDQYHLLIANVGDSMGIVTRKLKKGKLKKRKLDYLVLNKLHKPYDPIEKARLETSGFVVVNNRFLGLAVSRAFGDRDLADKGIICKPEFRDYEITNQFQNMILASDGLWDVVTEEKVLELVQNPNINAESLANYALDNGTTDNVTVIICDFASLLN